ncbi:MAG TPA: sigma-70 family RNA polymerase sigma factor [Baekduia sp.]|nr:sigma-70 family RNA polymerase sigma factor [Baekduia sp.]
MLTRSRPRSACAFEGRRTDAGSTDEGAEESRTRRVVGAARAGDREALGELYVLHAAAVHAHVLRMVKDADDADDVTQQVFAKLLTTGLDRYRPGEVPFMGWVLRVARNTAIDHLRRARAHAVDEVQEIGSRDEHGAQEVRASLRAALARLPQGQRDVLLLTHLVGLEPREIATLLGCSVRAVHGLHYRGRAAARVTLTDLGSAPVVAPRTPRRPVARLEKLSA